MVNAAGAGVKKEIETGVAKMEIDMEMTIVGVGIMAMDIMGITRTIIANEITTIQPERSIETITEFRIQPVFTVHHLV